MTRLFLLPFALAISASVAPAQVSISGLGGGAYTEGFTGFTGDGFDASPLAGQLDSDVYAISGFGDNVAFGGTATTGDAARGASTGGVSTGGVYAFDIGGGDATWGVQPGSSDFTPGSLYVRFVNDTGSPITSVTIAYDLYVNNNEGRSNSFFLETGTSNGAVTDPTTVTYAAAGAPFGFTSAEAADGLGFTLASQPSGALSVSIAAGDEFILAFSGDDVGGSGSRDEFALDNLSVTFGGGGGGGQTVTLSSSPADGGSILEDGETATSVTLTLTTSDGNVTEGPVWGEIALTTGVNDDDFTTTSDVAGMGATPVPFDETNPVTVDVPAGTPSGTTIVIEVTAVDDMAVEGTESFVATVQNVTGATVSGGGTFAFDIQDDDLVPATDVRINEVRIDQDGANAEFVELSGTPGTLDGLTFLVLGDVSTNGGVIEEVTSLTGQSIPADGYFLIAESTFSLPGSVDLETTLTFENSDNVTHLLVEGFTGSQGDDLDTDDDGTLDSTPWTSVVDAVGLVEDPDGGDPYYGGSIGFDDVGPDGASVPSHVYRNESTGTYQIGTFDALAADAQDTPGTANPAAVEVTGLADQPGWRLITLPIDAATLGDLAEVDLVQGVTGQYADADDNVLTDYDGATFTPAASSGDAVAPGASVFKYFFDVDFDPVNTHQGGGTSESNDLSGFVLSLAGSVPTGDVSYTPPTLNADGSMEGFYMIGNPFDEPFDLFGITQTAGDGALNTTFQAWDPAGGGGAGAYTALDGSADDGAFIDVFQGVIAQVDYVGAPTTGPTFSFAIAEVDAAQTPGFVGLEAAAFDVGLTLTGETADGTPVGDALADLWFRPQGALGRDRVDASEIAPPGGAWAQLALVEGGVYRAVRGVPVALDGPLETPVAFRAAAAGTFTVGFDAGLALPEGVTATLTDRVTGLVYEPGQTVTFEAGAADWTERFTLFVTGSAVATDGGAEAALRIGQVFPNPAAGPARLGLAVDAAQRVTVEVFDALGRRVATAHDGDLAAGVPLDVALPGGLAPGAYAVRVTGETFAETRRMVVVR